MSRYAELNYIILKSDIIIFQVRRHELDIPGENVEVVSFTFAASLNKLYVAFSTGEVATLEEDEV